VRTITTTMLEDLIAQAGESERKRTIFRLHEHEEPVQRMVNALVPGTYITPHKHGAPPKVELLSILCGKVAALEFGSSGDVTEVHILDENGSLKVVDIVPNTYHCMVALEPAAVLEIVQGPYNAATHKQFADFAPHEGIPETATYLRKLEDIIDSHLHR